MTEKAETDKKEQITFITNDKWLREKGVLDPTDKEVLEDAAPHGEVVIVSLEEALIAMEKENPEKFREFEKEFRKDQSSAGIVLTKADIVDLAMQGDQRKAGFDALLDEKMTEGQAAVVSAWRISMHYTWRSIARASYNMVVDAQWKLWRWDPPSNQLMGMALCERAAKFFDEDYRKPPWN